MRDARSLLRCHRGGRHLLSLCALLSLCVLLSLSKLLSLDAVGGDGWAQPNHFNETQRHKNPRLLTPLNATSRISLLRPRHVMTTAIRDRSWA